MRRAVPPRWRDRRGDWAGAPSAERRNGHGLIWIKGRARGRDRTLGRPRRWRGLCATGSLLRDYEDPNDGRRCPAIFKDVDFLS
jgi:hypothetical protein